MQGVISLMALLNTHIIRLRSPRVTQICLSDWGRSLPSLHPRLIDIPYIATCGPLSPSTTIINTTDDGGFNQQIAAAEKWGLGALTKDRSVWNFAYGAQLY